MFAALTISGVKSGVRICIITGSSWLLSSNGQAMQWQII
jgi:hypothetical protein